MGGRAERKYHKQKRDGSIGPHLDEKPGETLGPNLTELA
jgi:hypothetical protein